MLLFLFLYIVLKRVSHLATLRHPLTLTHCMLTPPHRILTHFRASHYHLPPFYRFLMHCCRALASLRRSLTPPCCP